MDELVLERYFINPDSTYWGSMVGREGQDITDHDPPKPGLTEVPFPPPINALQTWNGTDWNPVE